MKVDKALTHYLANHVETEVAHLNDLSLPHYQYCLVVPAHRERLEDVNSVWIHKDPGLLIILVVNSWDPLDRVSTDLLTNLLFDASATSGNLSFVPRVAQPDLLVVDRCRPDQLIPRDRGVGLARKIGADLALALISKGTIETDWIHSTDADVYLPPDYFDLPRLDIKDAAVIHSFQHRFSPKLELASRLYDIAMHYYVLGLRWAGSRNSHHSIGSTLSISARHYARVRGFPRRNAGEDFYLLNKLAKSGRVSTVGYFDVPSAQAGSVILIDARLSDRAPFGTGVALQTIAGLTAPIAQYLYYDPRIFDELRTFIQQLDEAQQTGQLFNSPMADCFVNSPLILRWLTDSGLSQMIVQQRARSAEPRVLQRFLSDWFDGFQTLKFIHYMRDTYYPSRCLNDICDGSVLPNMTVDDIDSVRALHQRLNSKLDEA
ncbi:MAG: hypothetical protein ACI96P_001348 [Candidatus Azotimanducaceae bacterium]|jgi:hypothetical protein